MDKQALKRSGRLLAPSFFTIGNMACGFYALMASHRMQLSAAAVAIFVGIVFDVLDGRVARLVHGESTFGIEIDSLADFLTFGIAPAHMMYAFILKDYGAWGSFMAFLFAVCGGLRLARFNALVHDSGGSKTHFTGLPIPAGASFLAAFILLYQIVEQGKPSHTWRLLMAQLPWLYALAPLMVVAIAFLMVSTIPFAAFKTGSLWQRHELGDEDNGDGGRGGIYPPRAVLILLGGAAAGFLFVVYPQTVLFLASLIYVLSGPALWVGRALGLVSRDHPTRPEEPVRPS
ncbi:MAG: CDP-diacylglycerol--serine O-phosphatidyltransferase [Elusimicrobia bacterium]|nr:CDP-diacylglycerol--serine O-phosphatidyltransferase [Elusimicrobiota bacterium]